MRARVWRFGVIEAPRCTAERADEARDKSEDGAPRLHDDGGQRPNAAAAADAQRSEARRRHR